MVFYYSNALTIKTQIHWATFLFQLHQTVLSTSPSDAENCIWWQMMTRGSLRPPEPDSNGISIGSAVFAQLSADRHLNCHFRWGSGPPSNAWFLRPNQAKNPNGIAFGSAVFAQLATECPYTPQWATLPFKIPLPMTDLDLHVIRGSLGPPEYSPQTASWISIGLAIFARSLLWWTVRPHYLVCNNRPHLRT